MRGTSTKTVVASVYERLGRRCRAHSDACRNLPLPRNRLVTSDPIHIPVPAERYLFDLIVIG
jgi:hypothetical protein